MPETFGARLRQRREEQTISLETVAQQTKIKASLLEALERDDVSHWPSGFFGRAFMRAYAQAIGLDAELILREFLALHPELQQTPEPAAPETPSASAESATGVPTRFHYFLRSLVVSVFGRRRESDAAKPAEPIAPPTYAQAFPSAPVASVATPSMPALAHLCTACGRIEQLDDLPPLLERAARLLDATGLIIWIWNDAAHQLLPGPAYGYSPKVLAQLPAVSRDADNATAAAFRSAQPQILRGGERSCAALVLPLLTSTGCIGVLAIELQRRGEQLDSTHAAATILASLIAQLVGHSCRATVTEPEETPSEDDGGYATSIGRSEQRQSLHLEVG
jgi:transcriptional regulator with XRE-family HTH domain